MCVCVCVCVCVCACVYLIFESVMHVLLQGLAGYYDRVVPQDVEECHGAISVYKKCLQLQQG